MEIDSMKDNGREILKTVYEAIGPLDTLDEDFEINALPALMRGYFALSKAENEYVGVEGEESPFENSEGHHILATAFLAQVQKDPLDNYHSKCAAALGLLAFGRFTAVAELFTSIDYLLERTGYGDITVDLPRVRGMGLFTRFLDEEMKARAEARPIGDNEGLEHADDD